MYNGPNITDGASSDTAILLMIETPRNFHLAMGSLRQGKWSGNPRTALGHDFRGKVLDIPGLGSICLNMAKKARAYDIYTIYHNRSKLQEDSAGGMECMSSKTVL